MKFAVPNLKTLEGGERVYQHLTRELKVKKILVAIGSPGLGDLIMAAPLFHALRSGFPGAEVFFLGKLKPHTVTAFKAIPYIDGLVEFEGLGMSRTQKREFLRRMKDQNWDLMVDTQKKFIFSLFFARFGARFRVGYSTGCLFSNVKFPWRELDPMHTTDKLLTLARVLGIKGEFRKAEVFTGAENQAVAEKYFSRWSEKLQGKKPIGVVPGVGIPRRLWPMEYFAPAIRMIDSRLGGKGVYWIFGSAKENGLAEVIKKDLGPEFEGRVGVPVADDNEFDEVLNMAALLEKCRLVFGPDGGLTHLASAMKVPVAAIYGPVHPDRFRPLNDPYRVLFKDVGCFPCRDKKCPHSNCMRATSPEEVSQAALALMEIEKE